VLVLLMDRIFVKKASKIRNGQSCRQRDGFQVTYLLPAPQTIRALAIMWKKVTAGDILSSGMLTLILLMWRRG
jgi:hypothetical protein